MRRKSLYSMDEGLCDLGCVQRRGGLRSKVPAGFRRCLSDDVSAGRVHYESSGAEILAGGCSCWTPHCWHQPPSKCSSTGHQAVRFRDKVSISFVAVLAIRHMIGYLCSNSHSALQKSSVS